jgi:coproporphyrinogen III oxidase
VICRDIENLENNKIKFKSKIWDRNKLKDEGGGECKILNNGKIFDKVGVNFSEVYGKFPKNLKKKNSRCK